MKWEKFRKKPIEIEALKLTKKMITGLGLPIFAENDVILESYFANGGSFLLRIKENGVVNSYELNVGDYIIRGVEGEIYPCYKSVFKKTYEKWE